MWIRQIKVMLASFAGFKVSWVRRSVNVVAHKLAKVGVGNELCKVWFGVIRDYVPDVIADEIPNFTFK